MGGCCSSTQPTVATWECKLDAASFSNLSREARKSGYLYMVSQFLKLATNLMFKKTCGPNKTLHMAIAATA